ncbi:MAG: hypothetical protein AMXMBFR13_16340 [Phycisphaerae bacterium]
MSQSRRGFLKQSMVATGLAGGLLAARPALAQKVKTRGTIGANERIRLGVIGCGGLGMAHHVPTLMRMSEDPKFNIELAAVCDIYEPRKQRAKEVSGAELFHDYRKLLERDDIHGAVIVTPDHWHAKMAIDAMEAGKDIHLEKPMTLHWEEARDVYKTAERLKRVVQVGAEGCSRDLYWQARSAIKAGKLGKVVWASGGVYRNVPGGDWNYPVDPKCTPKTLDWDAFLGPAPKRSFDPERYFRYRKYWDYSGGLAHDLIAHVLSALQICIGAEFPSRVSAAGGVYCHKDRETPDVFHMMAEYPSQYTATLFCTQCTETGAPLAIRGEKAAMSFPRHQERSAPKILRIEPEKAFSKDAAPEEIGEQPRMGHDENFIHCMRTREKTHCDALTGYKVMVALDLAVRSWREGKMFTFDPHKQVIVA